MNKSIFARLSRGIGAALLALALPSTLVAQVPGIMSYQGRITSNGTNYAGPGQFKFALIRGVNGPSLWSNDGTSANGSEPTASVATTVADGVFNVPLGDTALAGMTVAIPPSAFSGSDVRLRIWFSAGEPAFTQLAPDQRMTSSGYAMRAAGVSDGAIASGQIANGAVGPVQLADGSVTTPKLANGAVTTAKLADGSVTPEKIPAESITGQKIAPNSVTSDDISDTLRLHDLQVESAGGLDRVQLTELNNSGVIYMNHGSIGRFLEAVGTTSGGFLRLFDALGGIGLGQTTVELGSSSVGGYVRLLQDNATTGVQINGQNGAQPGGALLLYRETGLGLSLLGSESSGQGSLLTMQNGLGSTTVSLDADASGRGSSLSLLNGTNATTVFIDGNSGGAGLVQVFNNVGALRGELDGQGTSGGGELVLKDENGTTTVFIEGAEGPGNGSQIALYKGAGGSPSIVLDADFAGQGRITTQVLEITGGSDLSENFDIQSPQAEPGMIVRIDATHPGELAVSDRAYDRTVAGVVSGAGGVKPGMLMGQRQTKADGKYPVALTGRVYCFVDATHGAIEPGDLITTSTTPGHGMKVSDHARAQGAIIGKAMTPLASGRGLVLVLVSLQ
jgi:hypothetical protein